MLDACFGAIDAASKERGLSAQRLEDGEDGYLGVKVVGPGQSWEIYIDCDEDALKLPRVRLKEPTRLLAHVSYDGVICISDGQGLSLDPDRHSDIVAYAFIQAYELLERSALDATCGQPEFFNELEGYWNLLPGAQRGRAAFDIDVGDRLIGMYVKTVGQTSTWYFTEWETQPPREFVTGKLSAQRALYLHLDALPPPPVKPDLLTVDYISRLVEGFNPDQVALWEKLLGPSMNGHKKLALMVSVPRAAGGRSVIGLEFIAYRRNLDAKSKVVPLTVRRHTSKYMRERGGASLELYGKHIAVIGCGAVGCIVADTLAASGVGKLTLVDPDVYSEDNVFRHIIDPYFIDVSKVAGLDVEFKHRYPGITVNPVARAAQAWLKAGEWKSLDGIVVAIGAPSVERSLARHFRKPGVNIPVVLTWLEAFDLGGHSVLTWSGKEGCLDCLYRDEEGAAVLYPRTSFLEPGQPVSRNVTGCSSTFIPYGAIQARRTGVMAADHILRALGVEAKPSYHFWAGEGAEATKLGFRTTPWFNVSRSLSYEEATRRVFSPFCKRCRGST